MLKRNTPTMRSGDLRRRETWVRAQVLDKYRTIPASLAVGSTEREGPDTHRYLCCLSTASDGRGDRTAERDTQRRSITTWPGIQWSSGLPMRRASPHCSARPPIWVSRSEPEGSQRLLPEVREAQPRQPLRCAVLRCPLVAGGVDIDPVRYGHSPSAPGGQAEKGGIHQTVMLVGESTRGPRGVI